MARYDDERDFDEDLPDELDIRKPLGTDRGAYAGFGLRLVAWFVDFLILCCAGMPIGMVINAALGAPPIADLQRRGPAPGNEQLARMVGYLVGLVIGWLYYALQESSAAQATLGKRAVGIIVTDLDGRRIDFGRASGRYFGKILSGLICGIGYLMVAFTEKQQGLHDQIAGTLVMRGTPRG